MRILIDVRLLSRGKTSGIEEYARSLIDALLHEGNNELGLFYNGLKKAPLPERWLREPSVTVIDRRMPNKLFDLLSRLPAGGQSTLRVPDIERDFLPDVVFSPHFNILPRTRAPRVITFHDLSFLHRPDFFRARHRLWHWLQDYRRQALRADRIVSIPTGPDLRRFDLFCRQEEAKVAEFRRNRDLKRPFLLYLGTIEPRKNLRAVIRAFNLLKREEGFAGLELVLAGPRGWLYGEILEEAQNSAFRDDIRFFGQVRNEERPLLYAAASLFVYPSFFEGFGFPPLEAQACGTPVVVSNRTSLPEVFSPLPGGASLADPWRVEEIADAAHSLLSDPAARNEAIRKGFENAERFRWPRVAGEMRKIFAELV